MKLTRISPIALASMMLVTPRAYSQPVSSPPSTPGVTAAKGTTPREASTSARLEEERQLQAIRDRGQLIDANLRSRIEDRLESVAQEVDVEARKHEIQVANRLSAEFDVTPQTLLDEKSQYGAWWGELVIAHTLAANTSPYVSAGRIFKLHDDGVGWSQIAFGLGLNLKQFANAAQAEARVALGQTPPDGKVAVIRSEGPSTGIDVGAGVNIGGSSGADAGSREETNTKVKGGGS